MRDKSFLILFVVLLLILSIQNCTIKIFDNNEEGKPYIDLSNIYNKWEPDDPGFSTQSSHLWYFKKDEYVYYYNCNDTDNVCHGWSSDSFYISDSILHIKRDNDTIIVIIITDSGTISYPRYKHWDDYKIKILTKEYLVLADSMGYEGNFYLSHKLTIEPQ